MPVLLRTTQNMLILFSKSRNDPDEAYGRNERSREKASPDFTFQSMIFGSNIV